MNLPTYRTLGLKSSLSTLGGLIIIGMMLSWGAGFSRIIQNPVSLGIAALLLLLYLSGAIRLVRFTPNHLVVAYPFSPFHKTLRIPYSEIAHITLSRNTFDGRTRLQVRCKGAHPEKTRQLFLLPAERKALVLQLQSLDATVSIN